MNSRRRRGIEDCGFTARANKEQGDSDRAARNWHATPEGGAIWIWCEAPSYRAVLAEVGEGIMERGVAAVKQISLWVGHRPVKGEKDGDGNMGFHAHLPLGGCIPHSRLRTIPSSLVI